MNNEKIERREKKSYNPQNFDFNTLLFLNFVFLIIISFR